MSALDLLFKGDAVSTTVAIVLFAMSVCSWVVIVWKGWLLRRAHGDVLRSTATFWQAASINEALERMRGFDRDALVVPLVEATQAKPAGTLAGAGDASQQLTRVLRDALHVVLQRLQSGQVLLATVGSTAPFVGLLGTVWGIYHALIGISAGGQASIDTAVEATKIGALAFLEKPITLQKLLKAVEQGLARASLHRAAVAFAVQPVTHASGAPEVDSVPSAMPLKPANSAGLQANQNFVLDKPLREARDEFEKAYFEYHLFKENGSMTRVADKTGLERTHLYRKLKQLGVDLTRGKRTGA